MKQLDQREKDIQALCKKVLNMRPSFWDNPNGAYENECPFCDAIELRGGHEGMYAEMNELNHQQDCAYLIAKDLSTNFNE